MKITIENIGVIRYAEMEFGDFTVICGMNNSGKTYVTYALYGFLYYWNNAFKIPVDKDILDKLRNTGMCSISVQKYIDDFPQIISMACSNYTMQLASVFSAQRNKFESAAFFIDVSPGEVVVMKHDYERGIRSANTKTGLTVLKKQKEDELIVTLFTEKNEEGTIPDYIIVEAISQAIKDVIFGTVFPIAFIASAERTGAAIFRKELNFARNKILDTISKNEAEIDPFFLLRKGKSDYAWPVDHNVEFVRNLESVSKHESDISLHSERVLAKFSDILGGEYQITDKDELFFRPYGKSKTKLRLTMDESSSSVRSLLDIGFYLKHQARVGDLLMIDEPELNLHPNNQRKMARLLASLVNCGLRVFVTTHSDYILRELSNLILMNGSSPHLTDLMEREGYIKEELIKASDIKLYTADERSLSIHGKRKTKAVTLTEIPVDDEYGITSSCFDDAINEMNRITDDIVYGG